MQGQARPLALARLRSKVQALLTASPECRERARRKGDQQEGTPTQGLLANAVPFSSAPLMGPLPYSPSAAPAWG